MTDLDIRRAATRDADAPLPTTRRLAAGLSVSTRAALLVSTCLAGAMGAGTASAQYKSCPTPSSTGDLNCTINSNDAVVGAMIDFTGDASTDEDERGQSGGTYELTNQKGDHHLQRAELDPVPAPQRRRWR